MNDRNPYFGHKSARLVKTYSEIFFEALTGS
jgi:hypothetical protein